MSGPVFVVGMNGSGTTMLLDCLGRHPELYAFPRETRLIPWLIGRRDEFGDLGDDERYARLWDEVRGLAVFRQVNGGEPVPLPADWRREPRGLAQVLDGVIGHFAAAAGKRRWCEKTPQHVQHIESLARLFPDAVFVHMVRDGRDCAASFNRRWKRTPELTIFRWKKVVMAGRRAGERLGPDRYIEVRYEDLTTDPERWLRRIIEFMGLEFDPAVLESAQPYLQDASASGRGLRPNSGKWQRYFPESARRRLERIAGRRLAELGYAVEEPEGDADPSPFKRRCWATADTLRQFGREIGLKLRGEIERPWSVILGKPLVALRQRRQNRY